MATDAGSSIGGRNSRECNTALEAPTRKLSAEARGLPAQETEEIGCEIAFTINRRKRMTFLTRLLAWCGRNIWLLPRIGIWLAFTPLLFQGSGYSLSSVAGARSIAATFTIAVGWFLLLHSLVTQTLADRAVQRGSIDLRQRISRTLIAYKQEIPALLIILVGNLTLRVAWLYIPFGAWLVVDIITVLWLRRRHREISPTWRTDSTAPDRTILRGFAVVMGFVIMLWLFPPQIALLAVGAAALIWVVASLALYLHTRARR